MLGLHHLAPWHWAIAGLGIALVTLTLQFVANRSLGISSGLEDLCALVSRNPVLAATAAEGRAWRMPFIGGLVLGGVVSALLGGGWELTYRVEPLDAIAQFSPAVKALWFFGGGLCIGFGTRLANGCTSGHGIFGNARMQPGSLAATLTFMAVGTATAQLVFKVLFR